MLKRLRRVILIVTCSLVFTGLGLIGFWNYSEAGGVDADSDLYFIEPISPVENKFINLVDGYSISIPKNMKVVDGDLPGLRIVLADEHRQLEIYKEPADQGVSAQAYINYSNLFLANRIDHLQIHKEQLFWRGMRLDITRWSREKLKRVDNDKNYYACLDITVGNAVYTFFVKSDVPLEECGGYMELIKDFYVFTPTRQARIARLDNLEKRKWNQETQAVFEKYFSDTSSLTWGIFEPSAPIEMENLHRLEQKLEYGFPFVLLYSHVRKEYDPCYVGQALQKAYDNGKIVELTLQTTPSTAGCSNMVYDILDGEYDAFLEAYARDVADFGHPVLFRPFNEMNGDWCSYSAYHTARDTDLFKELYRYVYAIFEAAQADNVIWIWNPNEKSFPDFKWNDELMYYPGDKYVDVIGITGYNTGTYYQGETWRCFTEIYDPLYEKILAWHNKPVMITEFACSSVGGNKEQWVINMFHHIGRYPGIKVAIWWSGCDYDSQGNISRPYFMDATEELIAIFKKNLGRYSY